MKKSRSFCSVARALCLSLLFGSVLASSAAAKEITIKHSQGEVTLPDTPKVVAVYDMASLDTLKALGVAVQGVPKTVWPESLKNYEDKSLTIIGSLFEPDYEAINAMQPDLIIVGGRSAPKAKDLAKIAPTIDLSMDMAKPIESSQDNILTLAKIFDKEELAKEKLAHLGNSIAALQEKASTKGTGLVVLTTGGKISVFGPGSRFGMIHDVFGIIPADKDLNTARHGQPISFEYLLEKNPDWLFVVDRDSAIGQEGITAQKLLDNDLMAKTKVAQNNRVIFLNAANWYLIGGGLNALQEDVDGLSEALDK